MEEPITDKTEVSMTDGESRYARALKQYRDQWKREREKVWFSFPSPHVDSSKVSNENTHCLKDAQTLDSITISVDQKKE